MTSGIDALLDRTRRRIVRVGPHNAAALAATGAVLVDTRPVELRIAHGEIPGALIIDRNVLEWRLDPRSPWRHAAVTDDPPPIIVLCQQGYASSLAAASLIDVGLRHVYDLDGGFEAWAAAGLPVTPARL